MSAHKVPFIRRSVEKNKRKRRDGGKEMSRTENFPFYSQQRHWWLSFMVWPLDRRRPGTLCLCVFWATKARTRSGEQGLCDWLLTIPTTHTHTSIIVFAKSIKHTFSLTTIHWQKPGWLQTQCLFSTVSVDQIQIPVWNSVAVAPFNFFLKNAQESSFASFLMQNTQHQLSSAIVS